MTLLQQKLPHPPLTLLFTVQEEVGVLGARHVDVKLLRNPAYGFNFDGSGHDRLILGGIGSHRLWVTINGIPAHAGIAPQNGVSAITVASRAIAALHELGWLGAVKNSTGSGSVNIGTIQGGSAVNVVAPKVELTVGLRSHSAAFRRRLLAAVKSAFTRAARTTRNASGQCATVWFRDALDYESFRLKPDSPVVRSAEHAMERTTGRVNEHVILDGGLDANWLTHHGIPTVTLSTGAMHGHTVNDALDLRAYFERCDVALALAAGTDVSENSHRNRSSLIRRIR